MKAKDHLMGCQCLSIRILLFVHFSLILALITFLPATKLLGETDHKDHASSQKEDNKDIKNDKLRIEKLFDQAFYYLDYIGNDQKADSVSQLAIQIAEASYQPELLQFAYSKYILSNNLYMYNQKALGYAIRAEDASFGSKTFIQFENASNLALVYLAGYKYDKALEYSYKALSIASTTDNVVWKTESYLKIGKSLEGKNQKIEAFRNYLNALSLAERLANTKLKIMCYEQLSHFYNLSRIYNKAIHYKLMQSELLKKSTPIDSAALMWTKYDLQVIDLNSNDNQLNGVIIQEILDFAKRTKHERMLKFEIALIRTHLIEANKIKELRKLYYVQFPDELKKLETENPGLYARINAFFCEECNQPDSAIYYFEEAELFLKTDQNKILQSNFYNRFGQFLLRQGNIEKAIEKFTSSYDLASEAAYFDYMLSASTQLESIYSGLEDYANAYKYLALTKALSDSINYMLKDNQMLIMEIDHESQLHEIALKSEKQATSRRHSIQYTAMIILIIFIFIVLLMLGSLKVSERLIKMLGFFSFIFLFEFIILIADKWIHDLTHGEPWKILLIKIFLIAILLPMHHWIEKRVVAFLLHPGLINISQYPMRSKLWEQIKKLAKK